MPRPRRSGVITLAERAEGVPTTRKSAGKGHPCEHPLGCKRPFTTWTIRGGRCDRHPLAPYEIPVIREQGRQPWVRGGSYANAIRTARRPAIDEPHPYDRDPGAT